MGRYRKRPDHLGRWQCARCKEWKYKTEFYPGPLLNGLQSCCILCQLGLAKTYDARKKWKKQMWGLQGEYPWADLVELVDILVLRNRLYEATDLYGEDSLDAKQAQVHYTHARRDLEERDTESYPLDKTPSPMTLNDLYQGYLHKEEESYALAVQKISDRKALEAKDQEAEQRHIQKQMADAESWLKEQGLWR
jgi:hypothetical protein